MPTRCRVRHGLGEKAVGNHPAKGCHTWGGCARGLGRLRPVLMSASLLICKSRNATLTCTSAVTFVSSLFFLCCLGEQAGEWRRGTSESCDARRCRPPPRAWRGPPCPAVTLAISTGRQGASRAKLLHSWSLDSKGKQRCGCASVPAGRRVRLMSVLLELLASHSLRRPGQCRVLPGTLPVPLASVVQQCMDETLGELGANTSISTEMIF